MFKEELMEFYNLYCTVDHPTVDHLPVLRNFAKECASVVEIGLEDMDSSWGILQGLSESPCLNRSYLGIDCKSPPLHILDTAKRLAEGLGISFRYWKANDLYIDRLETIDMLFIDSLHTYYHLLHELEKFSSQVRKYIVMHDTASSYGFKEDDLYRGDYSEYFPGKSPASIDRNKKGLWAAVTDFLAHHPEWKLLEHRINSCGLTTLQRVGSGFVEEERLCHQGLLGADRTDLFERH